MAKSKFDFVSVVIVAACILALIFLIYKTINMYNQNKATQANNTELSDENGETDLYNKDSGTYQFDDDEEIVTDEDKEGAKTDANSGNNSGNYSNGDDATTGNNATNSESSTTKNSNDSDRTNGSNVSNTNTRPSTSYSNSSGRYMVVAGSFRQKVNAEGHATKLRRMGYDEAKVSIFNRGAYASVLVDRFGDRSDANSLARELENKGIDALVITKR